MKDIKNKNDFANDQIDNMQDEKNTERDWADKAIDLTTGLFDKSLWFWGVDEKGNQRIKDTKNILKDKNIDYNNIHDKLSEWEKNSGGGIYGNNSNTQPNNPTPNNNNKTGNTRTNNDNNAGSGNSGDIGNSGGSGNSGDNSNGNNNTGNGTGGTGDTGNGAGGNSGSGGDTGGKDGGNSNSGNGGSDGGSGSGSNGCGSGESGAGGYECSNSMSWGGGTQCEWYDLFKKYGYLDEYDPLVLDLNNDSKISIINRDDSNSYFNHNADNVKFKTSWIGKDDGILVFDKNNNGLIDNGNELFGNFTEISNSQTLNNPNNQTSNLNSQTKFAINGYHALSLQDSNNDGKIDTLDENFSNLKIWQDLNEDGISQSDELKTLKEHGIKSISLNFNKPKNNNILKDSSSNFKSHKFVA
ncbi:hypothetical protein [Campylobacter portucalensis]|uniref:hypothetical protein n=1 Tax=Campylobacter portucalensis TaxID=2608384 RepID=UPI0012B1FF81|nr:hypothetical protein [Campylobacter portucalensis]